MKITLGSTVIVDTLDAASGVWPSLANEVQIAKFLRGSWADFWSRGGRVYTLPVIVWDPPHASAGDSLVAMFERLEAIPDEGALRIEEGTRGLLFAKAALRAGRVIKRLGISVGYEFTLLLRGPITPLTVTPPPVDPPVIDPLPSNRALTLGGEDGATQNGELIAALESKNLKS